jgi:hypothetical protein
MRVERMAGVRQGDVERREIQVDHRSGNQNLFHEGRVQPRFCLGNWVFGRKNPISMAETG